MTALRRADAAAPARRLAGARVATAAAREYPRRVQALEVQFAGFAGQLAEFGGRLSSLEGRIGIVEQRLDRVEARLDRLEALMTELVADVKRLTVEVAELKGKISQQPTFWQLVFANVGTVLATSGLVFAVARATLAH
jgi:DNA repair ATPase RecN